MEQSGQQYDEASTIFSPDGRLYQVEYAREAVKKGSTTMGFKWKDGVLLLAHKPEASKLVNLQSLEKIYQIDTHIACVATGLVADGRHLVEMAREEAQWNKVRYDEPITVKELVNILCEYTHLYTQFDGVRPFGVVLLIGGIDSTGKHLFSTDPSGAYLGYKAVCEGKKSTDAMTQFTKSYTTDISLDQALELGLQTMKKITKQKFNAEMIEAAVIDKKTGYHKMTPEALKKLAEKHTTE
ncbi:MAG: archaeal proteasome endopeptidase complex subunit alpha [Candidatus Thermoplasmatota archaeon]|jgi:proteasome alpha subunit|nr:archaeal proteasome endopeptidase complex subunit alpha [Candidatus Thermoplasmatota archaeon]